MPDDADVLTALSENYRRFAVEEARGVSALYESMAGFIAQSPEILHFLASLPAERRQPNLFLAAVRYVAGVPASGEALVDVIRRSPGEVRQVMLSRTTQTNEPGRCAVLLPVLAGLPQPLALLEVGASAGLCLLPDRYGYDYGAVSLAPEAGSGTPPVFPCRASAETPLPGALPTVVWRTGLDLNPLDVYAEADMGWLETLVWPGQQHRAARLRAAVELARQDPPWIHRGDLLTDLPALMDTAPADATLVVFHTAVLAYVPDRGLRERFAEAMTVAPAVWISNESPRVFPHLAASAPPLPAPGQFLLSVDGAPIAWTGPHGQSIDWFGGSALPT